MNTLTLTLAHSHSHTPTPMRPLLVFILLVAAVSGGGSEEKEECHGRASVGRLRAFVLRYKAPNEAVDEEAAADELEALLGAALRACGGGPARLATDREGLLEVGAVLEGVVDAPHFSGPVAELALKQAVRLYHELGEPARAAAVFDRSAHEFVPFLQSSRSAAFLGIVALAFEALGRLEDAAQQHLLSAKSFGHQSDLKAELTQLAKVLHLWRRMGRASDASSLFADIVRSRPIRWRTELQTPPLYYPMLPIKAVYKDGRTASRASALGPAWALEESAAAITAEFEALVEAQKADAVFHDMVGTDSTLVLRGNGSLWQDYKLCQHGVWNEEHCRHMPTACALLRSDPTVSGVITHEKIALANAELAKQRTAEHGEAGSKSGGDGALVDRPEWIASTTNGHVPNLIVAVLRLAPGARLKPHTGITNARLVVHLGLRIPPDNGIRVGKETRSWEAGKTLVFDDSFEHEVWNNSTEDRYILHMHMWHPTIAGLAELPTPARTNGTHSSRDEL